MSNLSGAEYATASPRARRVCNGESRCQAPERGGGEAARAATDEVAARLGADGVATSTVPIAAFVNQSTHKVE
jgi:hypothetical protein